MKTQQEILDQFKSRQSHDILGFEVYEYLAALTFENAKPFLKEDTKEEDWIIGFKTDEDVVNEMKEYLFFAFDKIINHRSISANRSVAHYRAWTWLIGDEEAFEFLNDDANYAWYGAPMIKFIADKYGVTLPEDESFNIMADGEPCSDCE